MSIDERRTGLRRSGGYDRVDRVDRVDRGERGERPARPAAAAQGIETAAARYRALFAHLPDALFSLDAQGTILAANPACAALCGTVTDPLVGRPLVGIFAHEDLERSARHIATALAGVAQGWTAEVVHEGGARRVADVTAMPDIVDGEVVGAEVVARDVTHHRVMEEQLTRQALHDPLTGLANRVLFRERVERALDRVAVARSTTATPIGGVATLASAGDGQSDATPLGKHVAVLFVDLDDFKTVNDSLGHAAGDALLEEVGARLLKATRGFDLVARLGGDEFGVLLEGMMRESDAQAVVNRVTSSLQRAVVLGDREVVVGASVGVAHARDVRSADELLRNADIAMYQAKSAGKGRHAEFDRAMHAAAVERIELTADLRHAVARGEMRLLYQPLVELSTGNVVGSEALLRWDHPVRGTVAPLAFVPLAEESGLIVSIGRWVLREACAQLARWHRDVPGAGVLSVSVNVSGRQLDDPAFAGDVRAALADSGLDAARLTLEITESVIMQRAETVLATLHELKALGVRLAIDDFGTGYSSLGYLQRFPVDVLKIDRAFVDGVARGGGNAALARTIIALGDALGLEAVAEGVEHDAQQAALAALGCQLGQGYLFARPLEAPDFAQRFTNWKGTPAFGVERSRRQG